MQTGSIVHLPSNKDLLTSSTRRIRTLSATSLNEMDPSAAAATAAATEPRRHRPKSASGSDSGQRLAMSALPPGLNIHPHGRNHSNPRSATKPSENSPPATPPAPPASSSPQSPHISDSSSAPPPSVAILSSSAFQRERRSHGSSVALHLSGQAATAGERPGTFDDDDDNVRPSWGCQVDGPSTSSGGTRARLGPIAAGEAETSQGRHRDGLDDGGVAARFMQNAAIRRAGATMPSQMQRTIGRAVSLSCLSSSAPPLSGAIFSSSTLQRERRSHGSSVALHLNGQGGAAGRLPGILDGDDEGDNVRPSWGCQADRPFTASASSSGGTRVRLGLSGDPGDNVACHRQHIDGLDDDGVVARFMQGAASRRGVTTTPQMRRNATEPCEPGLLSCWGDW